MSDQKKLDLVILWHMHQPDFRDHASGEFAQPWVYLHAIKDYSDMAAHLEAHPGMRVVLNFTPVLLDQLEDYTDQFATGRFRDPLLRLLAQPDLHKLDQAGRDLILKSCFRANQQKLIDPYPAYKGLFEFFRIAQSHGDAGATYLSAQYFGDLLSWYHISWMGETVRRRDGIVPALIAKAQGFSHDDRVQLLQIIGREVRDVIPRYRTLFEAGRIELTTTPEYHPIGPLLLSFESAREAVPGAPLPESPNYPGGRERALAQADAAKQGHARRFGRPPRGMWPAEGAVSRDFADLLAQGGCDWIASGEGVLVHSLQRSNGTLPERPEYLFRSYRIGDGPTAITCFFRDDRLSDLIGFEYAKWNGNDAAAHFVTTLADIAATADAGKRPVVSVILDGENAWEYYPYNGYYFLDELYAALEKHPQIATATFAQLLDENRESAVLPVLVAGSWVYGNLATWIGSHDKNRAWDLLCAAKRSFDTVIAGGQLNDREIALAIRQLADCEASDWCWWFGDYNPAESVMAFDELYRHKLAHLYRLLKLPVPGELDVPISHGREDSSATNAMRRAS
ncbi:MAG TPA: glycoside hydrolase family 57 protein [Burkholderiales bacterium]|nr:glycoside hydrolase family 57 protein [Burkholderiales bacterium]